MANRTALPLLLTLTYRAYWYCSSGDYIEETPLFRLKPRVAVPPAQGPLWGLW